MKKSQYFYDKQVRRYLLQLVRLFSGFSVSNGMSSSGVTKYRVVPCTYADMSRMGATYLNSNSENVLQSAPMITFHITEFQPLPEYRHTPHYEGTSHFTERQKNAEGKYINKAGSKYTVKQLMPVPFTMTVNIDIWTTSTEQKLELLEQLLVWFNPGFEFRVTDSPFAMGRVANIELENVQWTSRSVPQGTSVEIDISTLTFKVYPVFITSPAKIRKQSLIHSVHTNITTTDAILSHNLDDVFSRENIETSEVIVTPSGYDLEVGKQGGNFIARLYHSSGYGKWEDLFKIYGDVAEDESHIRIRQSSDMEDDENDIYATFSLTDDPTIALLNFDTDTFKPSTIGAVDKIINPNSGVPTDAVDGSRYLLGATISIPEWGVVANQWDIIERVSGSWQVVFDSQSHSSIEYVLNLKKMDLYSFDPEHKVWISATMGTYKEGFWAFNVQKIVGN